ncbi:BBE domain-containing protein [Ureibacillus acetophenoni]
MGSYTKFLKKVHLKNKISQHGLLSSRFKFRFFKRLTRVKAKYDPENIFKFPQSILPARGWL